MTPYMELVVRNRVFLLADLLGWVLIPVGALALVTGGAIGPFAGHLVKFTAIAVCFKLAAMWWWGLYRRYWRYASIEELGLIALALVSASVLAILAYYALGHLILTDRRVLPPAVPVMDLFFTLAFVGGARFSVRLREHLRQKHHGRLGRTRVLIVGAGHAGTMIARELRANPQLDLEPVGFIDDDVAKHGNTIHGLPVLGGRERIGEIARDYAVTQVIIAMPTVPGSVIREIRDACARARLQTKTIPGVFEILAGRVTVNQIRDVRIDDLLRRRRSGRTKGRWRSWCGVCACWSRGPAGPSAVSCAGRWRVSGPPSLCSSGTAKTAFSTSIRSFCSSRRVWTSRRSSPTFGMSGGSAGCSTRIGRRRCSTLRHTSTCR